MYTLYASFLWAKLLHSFFFFFALWWICLKGIFFMNKGFDAYSFLCEMGGSIVPWGKLHSANQSSCDPLCLFKSLSYKLNFADHVCDLLVLFNEVWLMPSFALLKWNLAYSLVFCWSQYGRCNSKTKMAGQTSCVCKYWKMTVLYMCFLCDSGVFPSSEASLKQTDWLFVY